MSSFRLASRYAKSLIQLAQEKGILDVVKADVELIDNTLESSRELRLFLKSPIVTTDKKLSLIKTLFGKNTNALTLSFLELLTKKGREGHLKEVTASFILKYNVINHITEVKLTSASKLDKATVDSIIDNLKKREKLDKVSLETSVDESLIAGFVLSYAGKQVDASVKTSLSKLQVLVSDDSYIKKIR
jgi:F-type H+-transporting ATPase subunit delta